MWRTPDLGLICCSRGNLTWCRAAADESGVYLVPQWATDSMLPLLISAGILSFGWGALYRVSRHNCCAPAVRAPYVPPARSRDGVWGRRVDPIKTALLITCNFIAFNQYFSQLFFFSVFHKIVQVLLCESRSTLWAAGAFLRQIHFSQTTPASRQNHGEDNEKESHKG